MTPQHLVEILSNSQDRSNSLLILLEQHDLPPEDVRIVVQTHGHIFVLQNEVVTLAPRLKLCGAHSSPEGCQSRDTCDGLHMCPKFIYNWCGDNQTCVLGHRWHTDHNMAILKRLFMERVSYSVLRQLLRGGQNQGQRQRQGQGQRQAGPLGVCRDYNEAGCDQAHCSSLHVCLSFVLGLTKCSNKKCRLNHDLLGPACCHLLKQYKLPVNEAPRDVAMALLQANPGLKNISPSTSSPAKFTGQGRTKKGNSGNVAPDLGRQRGTMKKDNAKDSSSDTEDDSDSESDSKKSHSSHGKGKKIHNKKELPKPKKRMDRATNRQGKNTDESSATETESEDSDDDTSKNSSQRDNLPKKQPNTKKQPKANSSPSQAEASKQKAPDPPKPTPRPRTLWAHDLQGNVATPEICYYSVETVCRDEATGCSRLHSLTHFHWQICVNDQEGRWFNLRLEQAACIERAFCDPDLSGVDLPRLDPSKLESSVRGLFIHLGRDVWHADFQTMSLTNPSKSKNFQLRRLCTQLVAGQTIEAATHHWYFQDINKKWVKYGKADTADRKDLVSSLTSADIEKHYLQNPKQTITFNNSKFTYVLDLTAMKQTNQSTQVSREVRRRPEPHMPEEETGDKAKTNKESDLPQHWEAMQPEERSRLVVLAPTSDECKKVVALIGLGVSPSNVIQVERIQNPFMWRSLQNKIKEMTAIYKDPAKVDVRQLFHGTSHSVVPSICAENFDWRLHGSASGQSYGRGTYFGTDAKLSLGYCRADSNNLKYMFVARVAVGSMVVGNSSMVRPPINPVTSMPFDSTVDNPTNPRLIVKYKTEEYYPEYLLKLI